MYHLLPADEVLLMEELPDSEQFWVDFYFANRIEVHKWASDGWTPVHSSWGELKRTLMQREEGIAFDDCFMGNDALEWLPPDFNKEHISNAIARYWNNKYGGNKNDFHKYDYSQIHLI